MEDLATIRRIKLEQCGQLATFQADAAQVGYEIFLYLLHNINLLDIILGFFKLDVKS